MAVTTGFSEPYIAKYSNTGTTVSYSGGMKLGRGVSMSIEVESADDNNFYADDIVAETETGTMTSASATVTVDGMEPEVAAFALGLPAETQETIGESQVDVYDYDDRMDPPFLGLGVLQRVMLNGVQYWVPIVFTKVKMNIPSDEANTQEDQIDWQTQELEMTILRDDSANRRWKRVFKRQATKADALNIITTYLKVSSG